MGREEGSGWGTHVYLWWIHFDIWQNQYNIVKLKNKIKKKKKLWKILKEGNTRPSYLSPEKLKKQQLDLHMEQLTGSNLGKEYKAVYCHPI